MHFSCKLTNTVIRYVEDKNEDVSNLIASVQVPEEFLRDPSYWIRVEDLETFLRKFLESRQESDSSVLGVIAKNCVNLRSWGVLDSVLRMMEAPGDVFSQPERLLSYFIAPAPPVDKVVRQRDQIAFDLPIDNSHFPLACEFLKHSFEMIPVFMGRAAAHCEWSGIRISLNWSPLTISEPVAEAASVPNGPNIPPLARWQREQPVDLEEIRHHVARLSDYMVRAQQVITMISASKIADKQVREALRRVDWDLVQTQFPLTVENCFQIFRRNSDGDSHVQNQISPRS